MIIDEIQYAPQLLSYIKSRVDKSQGGCSYWLTGSQHFHLMRGVSESLAGRVAVLKLLGFSRAEEKGAPCPPKPWPPERIGPAQHFPKINLNSLFNKIVRGSFPKLLHKDSIPLETFYGSYVQTYIDRDLRDRVRTGSLSSFEKFIRLCAARTAQLLNLSDLARDSNISVNTAKEWLSLLEAGGHLYLLRPYYRNISKRLIKTPKLYFLDTGLVCYLTGWTSGSVAMKGAMAGALFEPFIVSEIIKSYWHHGQEAPLWYFRTKEKEEVDLLIDRNGRLYPIEIKLAARITEKDLKGFAALKKTGSPLGQAIFISASSSAYSLARGAKVVPYSIIDKF